VRGRHWWRARRRRSRLCGRSSTKCRIRMPMWVASTALFERERAGGRGIENAKTRESLIDFRESEKARKRERESLIYPSVLGVWTGSCEVRVAAERKSLKRETERARGRKRVYHERKKEGFICNYSRKGGPKVLPSRKGRGQG